MPIKPVFFITDGLIFLLAALVIWLLYFINKRPQWKQMWIQVFCSKAGMVAAVIFCAFSIIGFLDSLHYQQKLDNGNLQHKVAYDADVKSLLDAILHRASDNLEKTYSAPFATTSYVKESIDTKDGSIQREHPSLEHVTDSMQQFGIDKATHIKNVIIQQAAIGILVWGIFCAFIMLWMARSKHKSFLFIIKEISYGRSNVKFRTMFATILSLIIITSCCYGLMQHYHIFGTDKVGNDVFYVAVKSVRTGLAIGTLTTLILLPFAVVLGIMAGFYRGKTDDVIQYIYTTLSSIPAVLLIAAATLSLQSFIQRHDNWFNTADERADIKLLALCVILGVTSWTSLCRLLRGETLKIANLDFIAAAKALNVPNFLIIFKHILPNVFHIVLISIALDFSGLVLAEAVLSYVGVGVDSATYSWGNMINAARLEMSREPVVWWTLLASFIFMFVLVLAANIFADKVRDAFDPRAR